MSRPAVITRTCSFVAPDGEECGQHCLAKGLCAGHYCQQKSGRPLQKILRTVGDRFWAKVGPTTETGCRVWRAARDINGFGKAQKDVYAHRFAWELANGPVPEGLKLANQCGNKSCVNHEHWEALTQREINYTTIPTPGSTSHYNGISFVAKDWQWKAAVSVSGRTQFLGYFEDELDAAQRVNDFLEARGEKALNDLSLGYTPDDRKYGSVRLYQSIRDGSYKQQYATTEEEA